MLYISVLIALIFSILTPVYSQDCPEIDITGSRTLGFAHKGSYYSTAFVPGASYIWRISGGRITEGQGTRGIRVEWYNSGGSLTVERQGGNCAQGENTIQVQISRIIKDLDYCLSSNELFSGPGIISKPEKMYFFADKICDSRAGYLKIIRQGKPDTYQPLVNGPVHAIEKNPYGGYLLAGDFDQVGGHPRKYLALLREDGTVAPWNNEVIMPQQQLAPDNICVDSQAIVLLGIANERLFFSGQHKTKNSLRMISTKTGNSIPWDPGILMAIPYELSYVTKEELMAMDEKYVYFFLGNNIIQWFGSFNLQNDRIIRIQRKDGTSIAFPVADRTGFPSFSTEGTQMQLVDTFICTFMRKGIYVFNKNTYTAQWFKSSPDSVYTYSFGDSEFIYSMTMADSVMTINKYNAHDGSILDSLEFPFIKDTNIVKGKIENNIIYLLTKQGGIIQIDLKLRQLDIPVKGDYTSTACTFAVLKDGFIIGMRGLQYHPTFNQGNGIYSVDYKQDKPELTFALPIGTKPKEFYQKGKYVYGRTNQNKIFIYDTAQKAISPIQYLLQAVVGNTLRQIMSSDDIIGCMDDKKIYFYHLDIDSLVIINIDPPFKQYNVGNALLSNGKCYISITPDSIYTERIIVYDALNGKRINWTLDKEYMFPGYPLYLASTFGDTLVFDFKDSGVYGSASIQTGKLINLNRDIYKYPFSVDKSIPIMKDSKIIGQGLYKIENEPTIYINKYFHSGIDSLPINSDLWAISNINADKYALIGSFINPDQVFQPGITYIYGEQSVMSTESEILHQNQSGLAYRIGPIPANDYMQIQSDDPNLTTRISDIYGHIVQPWQNGTSLDLQRIPAGFYILHIQSSSGNGSVPFTILR
jgi:hypothetical protein